VKAGDLDPGRIRSCKLHMTEDGELRRDWIKPRINENGIGPTLDEFAKQS
jgi:hypothetical protein